MMLMMCRGSRSSLVVGLRSLGLSLERHCCDLSPESQLSLLTLYL